MGKLNFNTLPINPLVGATWNTFVRATKGRAIDKKYRSKYILTAVICRILSILAPIQNRIYKKRIEPIELENDPLFILGHWRSGTTVIHNVMSQDKRFGYTTTYQTVFPNIVLWGQDFFKRTMAYLMPDKRPADNMELNVDFPQEEEFALSNMTPCNYYNFWYFPRDMRKEADHFLTFKNATDKEKNEFKEQFKKLVKISMENTGGDQYLSKNPPHTARVKELLEIYPNAKFIYIIRNPYTVLESTRNFFYKTIIPLQLQDVDNDEFELNIMSVYKEMYDKYEHDKHLIPAGNLIEIKFEEFEISPAETIKRIYNELSLENYDRAKSSIDKYLDSLKGYKKNDYKYAPDVVERVNKYWKFAIDKWGYSVND